MPYFCRKIRVGDEGGMFWRASKSENMTPTRLMSRSLCSVGRVNKVLTRPSFRLRHYALLIFLQNPDRYISCSCSHLKDSKTFVLCLPSDSGFDYCYFHPKPDGFYGMNVRDLFSYKNDNKEILCLWIKTKDTCTS